MASLLVNHNFGPGVNMNEFKKKMHFAIGLNLLNNSFGFLIKNQLDINDTNWYIVFPDHCLSSNTIEIPFLFENVNWFDDSSNPPIQYQTTKTVYFSIIGSDNMLDLAVGVFNKNNEENDGYFFDSSTTPINILPDLYNELGDARYNVSSILYYMNNSDKIKSKSVKNTTVENFNYNGSADMIQFFYPKSILLQEDCLPGTSGSPLIDNNLNCLGMIVHKVGYETDSSKIPPMPPLLNQSDDNNKMQCPCGYQPVATHCLLLYHVIFRIIIPNYLNEIKGKNYADPNPNILNDSILLAEYLAKGIPKKYLGFFGQYFNQGLIENYPELELAHDLDGFIITGFYNAYDLSKNEFLKSTYTKNTQDNSVIRIYSPFTQLGKINSKIYELINRNRVRIAILTRIEYKNKISGQRKILDLGNSGYNFNDSISEYIYFADDNEPFIISYYIYSDKIRNWIPYSETIDVSQQISYPINGNTYNFKINQFPTFILGNEPVGYCWNRKMNGERYWYSLLNYADQWWHKLLRGEIKYNAMPAHSNMWVR